MKIFDMHTHHMSGLPVPEDMLSKMSQAGIEGGCVFSLPPLEYDKNQGKDFEERLESVLQWSKGHEDRLFPIIWIHPYEENITEKVHVAVERGICGFKIICTNFYVYEEKCIKLLKEIAATGKPVFFHSGILWDGKVSSEYNRPLNWEALLPIKGLRFSMGHCSWPWIDECIAMYGKFLNALTVGDTAEMFFDITPGTPEIYRRELLTKLYTVGYDVGDNIMFGTDSYAEKYSSEWAKKWLKTDGDILDSLGVSGENRNKLYHDNLLRFLGKTQTKVTHAVPTEDDAHTWYAHNREVEQIAEKWYNTLGFPKRFDSEFKEILSTVRVADTVKIDNYNITNDGKRDLYSYLYMCESLSKKYAEKGISGEILIDTLKDIVRWTNTWSGIKKELYLGECAWLKNHLSMRLFKLGRLQFCMAKSEWDIPEMSVEKGDNIVEVHIPEDGPLSKSECEKSFEQARAFFAKYYPEYDYKCFTCHSWLLDSSLADILSEKSNIIEFQKFFAEVSSDESDAILRYVFSWDTTRESVKFAAPASAFAQRVKDQALKGRKFYETAGVAKR